MLVHRSISAWCCGAAIAAVLVQPAYGEVAAEPLTLSRVRALVVAHHPALAGFTAELRARTAHAAQRGRLPNPQLQTDLENVGGTGQREGFEQTETTLMVSQLIELGGKRAQRQRVAALEMEIASWSFEAKKRDVLADATKAFIRALTAQERVALAKQLEDLAQRAAANIRRQVDAGASPTAELARANVLLETSMLERHRAERALVAARYALAASWGDDTVLFGRLAGNLTALPPRLTAEDADAGLAGNPDLARAASATEERSAALALARATRIPNVTVGAGARHFSNNDDYALVFQIVAPLPVFDRNQGGIAEAHHLLDQAHAERDALRRALRAALAGAHAEMLTAHQQATRLRDHLVPAAQRAFDDARAAYRQGLFRFVDVLDAQRTLFALRGDYLTALETFHIAASEVERLTGRPLVEPADEEVPR